MDADTVSPLFERHFHDPLYSDEAGEFAPFGTDEGADILVEWTDRSGELHMTSTMRDVLADGDVESYPM